MKPQNNEFLNNLLSKYSEFEGILHGDKESGSTKKKIKAQPEEHGAAPEMIAYGVQQKALNILAEISSIVSARSEGKKHQGKEGEERMSRVISKFLKRYPKAQDVYREELGLRGKRKIVKTVPTMNDLLDEIGVSVGEILSQSQSFIPDIYRTSANDGGEDGIITGSGNGLEEVRSAPKYDILMQVLSALGVDPRNVSVTTETMNPKRMRKYPYKIVHIVGVPHPITLTVSDEIGQSTYIYGGYVDLSQFIEAKKGSTLSGVVPEEVIYGEKYREGLERVIGRMLLGEAKKGNSKEMEEKNLSEISNNLLIQSNLTPEILRYQAILLGAREELKKTGIMEKQISNEMVWCFDETQQCAQWPNIGGKNLRSFPNAAFNKEKGTGDKNGIMLNPQELAKMFETLGLQVATEDDYLSLWRDALLNEKEALREVGIMEKQISNEMVWCFDQGKGCDKWQDIGGKSLKSFPNSVFNKTKGIGDKNGIILSSSELSKMFEALGLRVATEEEYISLWREELLGEREALKEAGIVEKQLGDEMVWCFDEAKGIDNWPNIGGKNLQSFPNTTFNKEKGIGRMANPQELSKMFETLGIRVATEDDYLSLWRDALLNEKEALREVGIMEKQISNEMVWCFDETQQCAQWPNIGGKNLRSFPNAAFNKEKGTGDKNGIMLNPQELAKMFETLGLQVATEDDYLSLWRDALLNEKEALREVGIMEKQISNEMVWCFDETQKFTQWPNIGGKNLMSFPNTPFNKEKNIGNKNGQITNPQELAKMFEALGLRVKHPEKKKKTH